jgi:hypothetical protein
MRDGIDGNPAPNTERFSRRAMKGGAAYGDQISISSKVEQVSP